MNDPRLKENLLFAVIRFKRADNVLSTVSRLQLGELAVMGKVSSGCERYGKGRCVSEIQSTLHISKPAVSQTLNSLEKKGYILRAIDPEDRRKITVAITAEGQAALEESIQQYDAALDELLEEMGEDNVRMLVEQIHRLMDILEAH